jgi:hypothetical protein
VATYDPTAEGAQRELRRQKASFGKLAWRFDLEQVSNRRPPQKTRSVETAVDRLLGDYLT